MSYLKGYTYLHDDDFLDFCERHHKTEDEVIEDMVRLGWQLGMDEDEKMEYWAPQSIETTMTDMPRIAEQIEWKYFTVGRGKKPYHFWTWGQCGVAYCYRQMPNGQAGCRRQVEPKDKVLIHLK